MGFASPLSGTAITGTVAVSSVPPIVVESGTIDASGSTVELAAGTTVALDASTASIGTVNANVTNATVPVSGSVDATIDGPVAIGGGTIYVVNPFTGETLPSPAGSTTTGNAALSSTDYNLVTWDAVPLPAGSPGNLVYDSNLTNAIAAVGPTWTVTDAIGTAAGDMNVLNGGADSAEWAFYGTGAAMYQHAATQVIAVIPGSTYTLAGDIDASAVTSGIARLMIYDPTGTTEYGEVDQTVGVAGEVSAQITIPAGVDQVIVFADVAIMVAPSGSLVTFSQIQLTQTSTVQPYEPGPLWTYPVYGRGGYLGETTALAYQDTGGPVDTTRQPPGINSSYPQLPAPGAPTVTIEGTAGSTTYAYQVTAQSPDASAGTTRLAPNPGANIGTMDIAAGAKVEIAAGSAEIGVVDVAAGASILVETSSGTAINTETAGNLLFSFTGSAVENYSFDVPVGQSRGLVLFVGPDGGAAAPITSGATVVGKQTEVSYSAMPVPGSTSAVTVWWVPIYAAIDTEVTVTLANDAVGSFVVNVWGDPAVDALPRFIPPAVPAYVLQSGGASVASVTGIAAGATGTILPAPGAGYSYRLQRATVETTGTNAFGVELSDSNGVLATISTASGYWNSDNLDGLLCAENSAVTYDNGTTVPVDLFLRYDIVATPASPTVIQP